jgi:hypothetical protein
MTPDLVVFAAGLAGISLTSVGYGLHAHDLLPALTGGEEVNLVPG